MEQSTMPGWLALAGLTCAAIVALGIVALHHLTSTFPACRHPARTRPRNEAHRMIRETRFLISRKPYAINLSTVTLKATERDNVYWLSGTCQAVWYRRKAGVTRACIGQLHLWAQWLRDKPDLSSPAAMLGNNLDSSYGGTTEGRWDGTGYWGAEIPDVQEQHLAVLRPMLANYPTVPDGYDGWWTFQATH